MAARKRALVALVGCARALSGRCSPPAIAAMAVVPRAHSPESGGALVPESARGFRPMHYAAFAGVATFAGVGIYMLCVPPEGHLVADESDGISSAEEQEGSLQHSANRTALNIPRFLLSTFYGDLYSSFRSPSGRDFKNLASAIRQHTSELRKTRLGQYGKTSEPYKHWFTWLSDAIGLVSTYFYLPETICDILACVYALSGGSMVVIGKYMDPTSSYLDPSMCFECPFSGCLSFVPLDGEVGSSSDDASDSKDNGEASHQVSSCAGDSNVTSKVGLQCVLAEGSQLGGKYIVKRYVVGRQFKSVQMKVPFSTKQF